MCDRERDGVCVSDREMVCVRERVVYVRERVRWCV